MRKNIQMQTPTQISCSQIAQNCTFSVYVFSLSLVRFLFEEQLNSNEIWWSENIDLPIRTYWCSFQIKHVAKSTHLQLHINRNKKLCSIRIWNVLHIRKLIHTRTGKQNELVWLKKDTCECFCVRLMQKVEKSFSIPVCLFSCHIFRLKSYELSVAKVCLQLFLYCSLCRCSWCVAIQQTNASQMENNWNSFVCSLACCCRCECRM